jgi:TRAP transporter TAXI family solute receptor
MTFRPLGEALAFALSRTLPDTDFGVRETPGSVRNIELLHRGMVDLGLALADVAYMAYNGRLRETPAPMQMIRGIALLHPSRVHVLVRPDGRIRSVADLRNRSVAVGPPGSGTAVTSEIVLNAFEVPLNKVQQHTLSFANAIDAFSKGQLDAVFVVAADPVDIIERGARAGGRLIDVSGPPVSKLRIEYPFFRHAVIPRGIYVGHPRDVETLSIDVLLICRAGLDDPSVRQLTSALFEVLPGLARDLDFLRSMDLERAAATPIPLHRGAVLHYREAELVR